LHYSNTVKIIEQNYYYKYVTERLNILKGTATMATVHGYQVEYDAQDKRGNPVASGSATVETDQHHDDHGGTHTSSFTQHLNAIMHSNVTKAIAETAGGAMAVGHNLNDIVLVHKSIRYAYKESAPYRQRVKDIIVNLARRAAAAYR
jgi:hypothetical protein